RVAEALLAREVRSVTLKILRRSDVAIPGALLANLAADQGEADAELRGALLDREDLPAGARLAMVEASVACLRVARIVKGAVAPVRLERLLRDAMDTALTGIGEGEAVTGRTPFASELIATERVSARVMLHAVVNGHVMFF